MIDVGIKIEGVVGDDKAHQLFHNLMQTSSQLTGAGVGLTDSSATAVYASLGAALGSLQIAGAILSRREDGGDEMLPDAINQDTVTLAICLLFVCMNLGNETPGEKGVSSFEFGPQKYKEALSMFQKLTGRSAEDKFSKTFVQAAHEAISNLN